MRSRTRSGLPRARLTALLAVLWFAAIVPTPANSALTADAAAWLAAVKQEAAERGISQSTISAALDGWEPIPRILELDQRQPEFTQTLWTYLERTVNETRIKRGRELLVKHRPLLEQIRRAYGVQPRFLVAIWALETNYGDYTGGFPVIGALATLAFDQRRSAFFRSELFKALKILDEGHIKLSRMEGSWAGAMGQVQFMPSTFDRYAVDHNGDGRRDIWTNLPDAFASAANYLRAIGWRGDQIWGREVRLPPGFDWNQATLEVKKPIRAWQELGVRRAGGGDLPTADFASSIILPGGHRGPAFMVYGNFEALLEWNRSVLYALSVSLLSNEIAERGGLMAKAPADDRPMSRAEVKEMQNLLVALGYDPGQPDGVIGTRTRAALRAFQQSRRLPADGYPTPVMLDHLRRAKRTS